MRAAAPLAFALRSSEADHSRKLRPVDGVEPSIAGMDRHEGLTCVLGCLCEDQLGRLLLIDATLLGRVSPCGLKMVRAARCRPPLSIALAADRPRLLFFVCYPWG